jgi:hypothetical protein
MAKCPDNQWWFTDCHHTNNPIKYLEIKMIIRNEIMLNGKAISEITIAAFLTLPIGDKIPQGTVVFHNAFLANG